MIQADIHRWLAATSSSVEDPSPRDARDKHRVKRRRIDDRPTPPQSMDSQGSRHPFDDATPRAKRTRSDLAGTSHSLSDLSMSSSSASAQSPARSGRVSPLKQMQRLRDQGDGLEMRPLKRLGDAIPPCLALFLDDTADFAQGRGIVAADAQQALVAAATQGRSFSWARKGTDYLTHASQGRTPMPGGVAEVVEAAVECSSRNYPEAAWNAEVHHLILRMALRPERNQSMFKQLINFTTATTATIIPDYGNPMASKRIDLCLYIDPQNAPASPRYSAALNALRAILPHGVVNYTDFDPLHNRFVALSIETKKPGEDSEAGKLQLGVWEMARWRFLRRLDSDNLPLFLPSVLVDGNEWYLLITTAEHDKTVLWHRQLIGSTSETKGVYQIVRTLQYVAQWARDVHWPYLRELIEKYGEQDE